MPSKKVNRGPRWINPLTKVECKCDILMQRGRNNKKRGLYKVYRTYDSIRLLCVKCGEIQIFYIDRKKMEEQNGKEDTTTHCGEEREQIQEH